MTKEIYRPSLKFFYDSANYINYEKIGTGIDTLIFLHGFGASLHSWDDTRDLFDTKKYTLYLLDLKGFGYSSKPHDERYQITDQSKIITAFLNHLFIKNVTLIGHSYGGSVALVSLIDLMKVKKDSAIKNIILIDAPATPNKIPFFVHSLRNSFTNYLSLNIIGPTYRARFILNSLFYNKNKVTENKISRYAFFFKEKSFNYSITKMAEQIIPTNLNEYLKAYHEITKPCLIIWGGNDPIFPAQQAYELQTLIRSSSLKIIEHCGHIPQEEFPQKTFELIQDFLNS